MDQERLADLIESSDLDGLIRFVDGLCRARDWDGVVAVRDRCRTAVDRGKQVWAIATFAEYRLALEADAGYAAAAAVAARNRFTLGPLWEVAASTHAWDDLDPHLPPGPTRAMIAHERVLRGDRPDPDGIDLHILDLPLALESWEPRYPVAVYRSDRADFPEVDFPRPKPVDTGDPGERLDDPEAEEALYELVRPWVEESNGRFEAVAVAGTARGAIRALGPHRVGLAALEPAQALAAMAWAGAGGGAYGRRRGGPVGRLNAWWVVAALGDVAGGAVNADEIGAVAGRLRWHLWDPGDRVSGWGLHLAAEDPTTGLAWAVSAVDDR